MPARYADVHRRSLADPEGFWAEAAQAVHWDVPFERVLDATRPPFVRWFVGGVVNTCYNALDRHVERGRGEQRALVYDSPVTGTQQSFSYRELCDRTARFAGALAALGVAQGDRVLIYMPNVPEAAIAMLACARIGAIHSVVFGGFSAESLRDRVRDSGAEIVITQDEGKRGGRPVHLKSVTDEALAGEAGVKKVLVLR